MQVLPERGERGDDHRLQEGIGGAGDGQDRERDVVVLTLGCHYRTVPVTKLYLEEAELYDIAFDWDVTEEVGWLFERLGCPRTVLEPGCGSGRMLEAFARLGVKVTGIDASPFEQTATYDGGRKNEWPSVGRDATGGLLWHELRVRRR